MTREPNKPDAAPTQGRPNGLAPEAPEPGQTVLVAGGGGYIGCVLIRGCSSAATACGCSTACTSARRRWPAFRDRIELVVADVRDIPDERSTASTASSTSRAKQRPDRRVRPRGQLADERDRDRDARPQCVERGIERYVFASSCSLYDGLPPGMHDETAPIVPRAAYATSKRYGEDELLGLVDDGLCPVMLRNGTVYGWSPRMRFDLVVNTFVKDALLAGALNLHGGGWMWRPLVDVRDVSDAMIAAYEAPAELVRGEIFNVLHSNYQIRELAMLVAGSVQLTGRAGRARRGPGAGADPRL